MPGPSRAASAARRHAWALLPAVAAAVAAWLAHRWVFPAYSWNRDEPVYLWHVEVLRSGQLTATDGGYPDLFHPWLSAHRDGAFFTQYTLGWPLVLLAASVLTGTAAAALPLGAALAVLGTYALAFELTRDRTVAVIAGAMLVASPLLPIQGGVHLSYLFTLGLGLLFGAALLSGVRTGSRARLVVAGLLVGWIFLTRPYDALLWGAAFGGYVLVAERARWRAALGPLALAAASAAPLVLLTLAYNRRVTGSWLEFPITVADPLDTFGFGRRRLMPTFQAVDYGLSQAAWATVKNAVLLPWFLVGSYLGVLVAGWTLWRRRRQRALLCLVLVMAVFPLGYFVFWGTWLSSLASRISGPIYFVPLYAPLCILIALGLVDLGRSRPRALAATVVALALATAPFAVSRLRVNAEISAEQEPWRESVAEIDGPALVIVADTAPYLMYVNPFSANSPHLDDRILYAADRDPRVLELIADQPDRVPYLQVGSVPNANLGPREEPRPLQVDLLPVSVERGPTLELRLAVPPLGAGVATVTMRLGTREETVELDGAAPGVARFVLAASELPPFATAVVTLGHGADSAEARDRPVARHEVLLRRDGAEAEALVPSSTYRPVEIGGDLQWWRTSSLPEMALTVTAEG